MKYYTLWIHHDETPVNVIEPREENMEEDDQAYLDKFIAELDAELLSAYEQGDGGGGSGGQAAEDEDGVNDGRGCGGTKQTTMTVEDVTWTKLNGDFLERVLRALDQRLYSRARKL